MVSEASITGLFKTLLIIIGAIVLLRFIGQLMITKRNMDEERELNLKQREADKERASKLKNFGKTSVISGQPKPYRDVEDVDFEEID